jgi:hypothetical protein
MAVKPSEIYRLTNRKLSEADFYSHVGHGIQAALLGSLWISKTHGCLKAKPKYVARKSGRGKTFKRWLEKDSAKTWHLKFDLIRHENYYPDPTGQDLYEIEESYLDMHVVKQLASETYGLYDADAVKELTPWGTDSDDEWRRAQEAGQNPRTPSHRPQIKITEFWGNVIDEEDGTLLFENCVLTVANEKTVIRGPKPNPLWHQKSPIVRSALLEVGNSVWHTALMDAGTKHNRVLTEMFNLMLDAGMQAVHNISQVRIDDLDDPKQVSGGILPGTTLKVRNTLPPGAKVYEPVSTGQVPPDILNMFQIANQENNSAMLTNDVRSGGGVGNSATRATAVVEASNTINSVFAGITKNVETKAIQPILELTWMTIAQNWDLIDKSEFVALFGEERGEQLSQLSPEEVFAATANGVQFEVFGLSKLISQQADFRKYTTLLQTLGASEVMIEAFLQKYGNAFGKLIEEIIRSLGIDPAKLKDNPSEVAPPQAPPQEMPPAPGPDMMSQVPQAASGSLAAVLGSEPSARQGQQAFPGSRALSNQGGNA